jgi:hypothetical protein
MTAGAGRVRPSRTRLDVQARIENRLEVGKNVLDLGSGWVRASFSSENFGSREELRVPAIFASLSHGRPLACS